MDYICIGKIVNTHGIKGEIRILSNFDKKDIVFQKDFNIYIGNQKELFKINTYRVHKNYDMVTLIGITNINEIEKYKGQKVYVKRSELKLKDSEYILDDLLNMTVVCNKNEYGIVKNIYDNNGNILLEISYQKKYYIPYTKRYIKKINLNTKQIEVEDIEGLII